MPPAAWFHSSGIADSPAALVMPVMSFSAGAPKLFLHVKQSAGWQSVGDGSRAQLHQLSYAGSWLESSLRLQPDAVIAQLRLVHMHLSSRSFHIVLTALVLVGFSSAAQSTEEADVRDHQNEPNAVGIE